MRDSFFSTSGTPFNSFLFALALLTCLFSSTSFAQVNNTGQYSNTAQQSASQQNGGQQMSPEQIAYMQKLQEQRQQQQAAQGALRPMQSSNVQAPQSTYKPERPFPELSDRDKKYLSDLLDYWQKSSEQIKLSTCDFRRWDYDPEIVNWRDPSKNNQLAAFAIMDGKIRFASPDKGMFETTQVWNFEKPPANPGEEPTYKQLDKTQNREKWICDGKMIYEHDFENKRLYEIEIPPEMQGNGLANSPLPFFLFGANKNLIMERYWIRVVTPKTVQNEYWLEAYPKRIEDARAYQRLEIIIAGEDFLPKSLHIYAPNYDVKTGNLTSRAFVFANRQVNSQLGQMMNFLGFFSRPMVGPQWKRVNLAELEAEQAQQGPALARPASNSTQNQNRRMP